MRPADVGAQALERPRRADDHDPLPEPPLRRALAAAPRAAVGEDGALARAARPLRGRRVRAHFGKLAARLDDLLNLLPARLAGSAIVAGGALGGERARRALAVMRRDRRLTASPNAGWTMAAMAGALGVVLDKRGAYRLGEGYLPWAEDIARSMRVFAWAAAPGALTLVAAFGVVTRIDS
ncbi:MAG: cobalamin biosynthesis protein [Candidatus Rokubacteria bacterium]|nr:cobalamin biosynthesis protein [Candidatus Rokubacteria bacterium]